MTLPFTLGAAGVAVGLVAVVLAVSVWMRLSRLRRQIEALDHRGRRDGSRNATGGGGTGFDPNAIRDVAVVRYDALQEMGGQLSFSLALLNAMGDGVVVSSINGRTETRTYAKVVHGGSSSHPLSPEEERAVRQAQLASDGDNGSSGRAASPGRRSYGARESVDSRRI